MIKLIVLAAALGLTVSGASACEYLKSVKSLDKTTVASVVNTTEPAMSTPETAVPAEQVKTTDPADQEG